MGGIPIGVDTDRDPIWGARVGISNGEYGIQVIVPVTVVGRVAVRPFTSGGRGKRFFSFFFYSVQQIYL